MDPSHEYARLAQRLRWAYAELSEVATCLLEMKRGELAAQCFDLELQAIKLHGQVLDLARQPFPAPPRENPRDSSGEQVPL